MDMHISVEPLCFFFLPGVKGFCSGWMEQSLPPESSNTALNVILGHSAEMTDAAVFIWRTLSLLTEPVNGHWFVMDQCSSVNHSNLCPPVDSKRL